MRRRAFSLIEVLIAIALIGAFLGSAFGFFGNLLEARQRAAAYAERERACSLVIDRLEQDLATCLVGDAAFGAGVSGDNRSIRVLSRSVASHLAEAGLGDPRVLGDLQRTEFRVSGAGMIEGRKVAVRGGGAGGASGSEPFWPVGRVAKVRFRYHDGQSWRDAFDSLQAGRLPVAVEVAIWFDPWPSDLADAQAEATDDADLMAPIADDAAEDAPPLEPDARLRFDESIPPPDRVRIIAIPDARAGEDDSSGVELSMPEQGGEQ